MADTDKQIDKFKRSAREHEADQDPARWDERLRKIVKRKAQETETDGQRD